MTTVPVVLAWQEALIAHGVIGDNAATTIGTTATA